ncbi:nucleotidyl transferase AbiEii/AbiGii toxin family protein [Selenomonas sp. AE3005]|uniref:nucleotidyl transferase AbiEii/AbiGii toxin family protein n=1 Tax=Selenomonas sp. AE3005 TaxID=1485543 RepID=UPI0025E4CE9B|nr:nucleotidyl transferase AbiEii/AbiGii toxin family protein [Selenomonas sp. AE3005]
MKLHTDNETFSQLQRAAGDSLGLPFEAIKRDYYIVLLLARLADSPWAKECVFKGGTSLSKCYPESIKRFSEDIDLTYMAPADISDKQCSRRLKQIEKIMSAGFACQKNQEERNDRNKSLTIILDGESTVKLEIGSSVQPDPYAPKIIKTYIQEFLERENLPDVIDEYDLQGVCINVLSINRTFIDKVMAVKRHAICGNISNKARHIYDVVSLLPRPDIQAFINDKTELKRLLKLTKETDGFYLQKRNISKEYNPLGKYDFDSWAAAFQTAKSSYEKLHENLLYTDEKQDFAQAAEAFAQLGRIFAEIDE